MVSEPVRLLGVLFPMVDTTEFAEIAGLIGTLTLIVFTWISISDSPWFGITARRHWVRLLRRRSKAFGQFHDNLEADELRRMDVWLRRLDNAIVLPTAASILVLFFGSVFGWLPVSAWVYAIAAMIGWMALSRFIVDALTQKEGRLASFAEKSNPAAWTKADKRLAIGFTLVARRSEFSLALALASPIGVFFSFGENPDPLSQQFYGAAYLVEALFLGIYWTWFFLATERGIESRLFKAFVKHRQGFRVIADVFYSGDGRVVTDGQVREIGEELRVRDSREGMLELRWKRVDLIVPHDPPSPTLDVWNGVA